MKTIKGGTARGSSALARCQGPGVNLDWPYPTCYSHFFTNLMKQHGNYLRSSGSYTEDTTTGWPTNLTAGAFITFFIITMTGQARSYVRPGVYEARVSAAMASAGWTVQFVDGGGVNITGISAAGSTCTATITDLGTTGDWASTVLNLRLTAPGSAGPYNVPAADTSVECYFQANKTRLDNYNSDPVTNYANMFDPDILADLAGFKVLRFKDWVGTDIGFLNGIQFSSGDSITCKTGITSYAGCRQESWRTWQMPTSSQFARDKAGGVDVQLGGQVPYSVCAKLAKAVGAGAFISLPAMWNVTPYDVVASTDVFTAKGHSFNNGDPVVLGTYNAGTNFLPSFNGGAAAMWTVYYVRDVVTAVSFKLARTLGGVAIDVAADSADGGAFQQNVWRLYSHAEYMALYTSIAQEMFTAAPGIDLILDVSNEVWNTPQPYGYHQFIDCVSANIPSPSAGSAYAWAQMRAWAAFEAVYPRSQIVRMISGQHYFFSSIMNQAYAYADTVLFSGKTIGQLIDAHCCAVYLYAGMTGKNLPASDGGNVVAPFLTGTTWFSSGVTYSVGEVVHMADGNNYRCILSHVSADPTNKPPNATYWVVDSSNGLSGALSTWNDAQTNEFVKLSAMMGGLFQDFYRTQGEAYTGGRTVGYITYEGGLTYLGQSSSGFGYSGMTSFSDQWQTWFRGATAGLAVQDFLNLAVKYAGIKTVTYYIGAGQWRTNSNTDCCSFGVKRSHHLADTEAMKAYRRFTP